MPPGQSRDEVSGNLPLDHVGDNPVRRPLRLRPKQDRSTHSALFRRGSLGFSRAMRRVPGETLTSDWE